jgi:hypothetical protein
MDRDSPSSEFEALATKIAESDPEHVVSASTFVYAWNMMSSDQELSNVPGGFVRFDFSAKQAMASAAAWSNERQRSARAGEVMLAILIQANPSAMETLVRLGYDPAKLTEDLLFQLSYSPGSLPALVSLPGVENVSSLPKELREAVGLKLSAVKAEASAGSRWESIWEGCNRWLNEVSDDYDLDAISQCSLKRYLRDESQAILKDVEPGFVLWSDLRRTAGGYWPKEE